MGDIFAKFLLTVICAWGLTKLIVLTDHAVGLSEFWLFENACDFIRNFGISLSRLLFWVLFVLFLITDWHLYLTQKLSVAVGFIIVVIVAVICIALAIKLLLWVSTCF